MRKRITQALWIMSISAVLSVLFFEYLHFSEIDNFLIAKSSISGIGCSLLIGWTIAFALYYLNRQLDRWIPWRNHFTARLVIGYASNTVVALAVTFGLSRLLISFFGTRVFWPGLNLNDVDLAWKIVILMLVSVFIYSIVYGLLYSYQHYAIAQIENLQSERKQLELQFEALKGQVSPHYLFNSLNTISSLVLKDLPSAEQFIRRLAQTYQYILATQQKQYVLLREELDFVQSYYYLLRIRFQQQLNIEFNIPARIMDSRIPPLTIQMLVENAVKHNNLSGDKKLYIYISALDNTYIKVINSKTSAAFGVNSFKVGLENIRKRYSFFTEKPVLVKDDEQFSVSLPVIPSKEQMERLAASL